MHPGTFDLMMHSENPMTEDEALAYLEKRGVRLKKPTFRSYRSRGNGPKFYLDAGHPRFLPRWLDDFIAARMTLPAKEGSRVAA